MPIGTMSPAPKSQAPDWALSVDALIPPMPEVDETNEQASTQYSHYHSKLSTRRPACPSIGPSSRNTGHACPKTARACHTSARG